MPRGEGARAGAGALAAVCLLLGGPAHAQAAEAGAAAAEAPVPVPVGAWRLEGEAVALQRNNAGWVNTERDTFLRLRARLEGDSEVILNCALGRESRQLTLSLVRDTASAVPDTTYKRRDASTVARFGGKGGRTLRSGSHYFPDPELVFPFDTRMARMTYNAAVRGEPVRFRVVGKTLADGPLPPINDAFKTFARTCPATR